MFEVRVSYEFAAAHFLRDYHGKCERLHGHNYTVLVHVRGNSLDAGGMLVDFTELKGALKTVCDALDHTNLNDVTVFDQNPSAERIARYIYDGMIAVLHERGTELSGSSSTHLAAVDVFETDRNRATYYPD